MRTYIALVVAALLSLSACTKSSFGPGSDSDDHTGNGGGSAQGNNKGVYIAQITRENQIPVVTNDTTRFEWRNDKLLSIKNCSVYPLTKLCKIQYRDTLISSISVVNSWGGDTTLYDFYYAGDMLLKIIKRGEYGYTLNFDYDDDGNPRKIGAVNLEWGEHNITSCYFQGINGNPQSGSFEQTYRYSFDNYDDKPSVFSGMKLEARMAYLFLTQGGNCTFSGTILDIGTSHLIKDYITSLSANNPGNGYLYQNGRPIKTDIDNVITYYKYTDGTGFDGE